MYTCQTFPIRHLLQYLWTFNGPEKEANRKLKWQFYRCSHPVSIARVFQLVLFKYIIKQILMNNYKHNTPLSLLHHLMARTRCNILAKWWMIYTSNTCAPASIQQQQFPQIKFQTITVQIKKLTDAMELARRKKYFWRSSLIIHINVYICMHNIGIHMSDSRPLLPSG